MKKNLVRIVALLLVAMLALTLLPMGAFAAEAKNTIEAGLSFVYTEDSSLKIKNGYFSNGYEFDYDPIYIGSSSVSIKTSDYDKNIIIDNELYDIDQFYLESYNPSNDTHSIKGEGSSIKIPGEPSDPKEAEEWYYKYWWTYLGYTPHQHKLSYWYSDSTTHWRECLVCKHYAEFDEDFMYQNWHSDGDEDRICDVCGADIPYHEVRVIESEGGTITVNETEAPHRRKIVATVEAAEGYKLKKLHFTKIRDDGSEQEITRYKKDGQFWTYMPTYDLEVSAEFVKK